MPYPKWKDSVVIENIRSMPEIQEMSRREYIKLSKRNDKIPGKNVIRRIFGNFNSMKAEVFGLKMINYHTKRPSFCDYCLYKKKCKYNYDLDSCEWYEEG